MSFQSARTIIAAVCLWIAILQAAVSLGGNVFQMVVIDPVWSASPPESTRAFFIGTPYYEALKRFHLSPLLFVGLLCLLGSLALYWNVPVKRNWILLAVGIQLLILIGTVFYVYPINDVLILRGGVGLDPAAAQVLARRWLMADRIRLVFKLAVFLCLLRALSLPAGFLR